MTIQTGHLPPAVKGPAPGKNSSIGAPHQVAPPPLGFVPLEQPMVRAIALSMMVLVHIGCLFAPWCFTWDALAIAVGLWFVSLCPGITVGYHRLLTHQSFKTYAPLKWLLAMCGTLAMQGPPHQWVGMHRLHHQHSDLPGDPHSPVVGGFLLAHIQWIFRQHEYTALATKCVMDLYRDRVLGWIARLADLVPLALGTALFLLGGWPWLIYGLCVRTVVGWHSTFLVNSASHRWGYRNFATQDGSKNNPVVALLTFGEGWHNNHHAYPSSAAHGMRWWEFDSSYLFIRLLQMARLAWEVQLPGSEPGNTRSGPRPDAGPAPSA